MDTINRSILPVLLLIASVVLWGCQSQSNSKEEGNKKVILGKLELYDGWARPGAKGQNSAGYLIISNGTASVDTLLSVNSDVAETCEIHESYQNDDGTVSMRPAGRQVIADGNDLTLTPGGKHIMLMKLKRELAVGDSVMISLTFSNVGQKSLKLPVKVQN